jgi:arylsulfatase
MTMPSIARLTCSVSAMTLGLLWTGAALADLPAPAAGMNGARPAPPEVLPLPEEPYRGRIGRTVATSDPAHYVEPVRAPAGAPNILVIMTDDVGFGAATTFGGPVPTQTFDALASHGLRYNRFHTSALCAPTRAALLTGRDPHRVGFGAITEMATGYPGYNSILPPSAATMGEVLRQHGYSTAWFGKNHNTPEWEQSAVGPFDRWPNRLGFDYFYGFMGGATSQWNPSLVENQVPISNDGHPAGYHLDRDLADRAIAWFRMVHAAAPDRPFMIYYAPGTSHSPHHVPADWIARFRGRFDQGWDRLREETLARQIAMGIVPAGTRLTPRPAQIPAWDSLNADQKRLYARMMETYAAALSYADHQIGRLIEALREDGQLDNTLVIYIQGDNGASGEGGLTGSTNDIAAINGMRPDLQTMLGQIDQLGGPALYNNYPVGWAWAMNTPFQWTKQVASHLGGIRNGMVISWPQRIRAQGETRSQFHFVADIAPTVYEAIGITPPARVNGVDQMAMDGMSMVYSFGNATAPDRRMEQVFEMQGNVSLYRNGWMLSSTPTRAPWDFAGPGGLPTDNGWQLYNLAEDFSQSRDLAAAQPERVRAMTDRFWALAAAGDILPLDNRSFARWASSNRPSLLGDRTRFMLHRSDQQIIGPAFPDVAGRAFRVTADFEVSRGTGDGTLIVNGGRYGGWGLFVMNGRPVFIYKASDAPGDITRIVGRPLPPGRHRLTISVADDGSRQPVAARLELGGAEIGTTTIRRTIPVLIRGDAGIGRAFDTLDGSFSGPFAYGGQIHAVEVELTGGGH